MHIERHEGVKINLKRIARVKRKYNLITQKRKKSKLRISAIKSTENRTCENVLQQNFKVDKPGEVYSTDVTYLINKNGTRAYLSSVKDLCTKEIVGFSVSGTNDLEFVINSVNESLEYASGNLLIHSDQGFQYTSAAYQNFLKSNGVQQSMSRKGNCLDNAPIESFFGHMKDECDVKNWKNLGELRRKIKDYIKYYNEKRPQWGLKRKTPVEYRSFVS
ncbi:MAG: hypothetical protein CL674_05815 [Bdellovibrionaceae bacterium]|nr:hypothetical protein [Pseudobdellovibrionaceae bacterium]MAF89912.1 hypothetical protein [Pseudobdellovibrionaceae bacterium]MAF90774.1 hypothetical protein [Pseudobdellovibrionaceae bacterium]|tara:strand:- start:38 stop:691 length:654 start_codon:yes stop_codon:yes gene_type:complete